MLRLSRHFRTLVVTLAFCASHAAAEAQTTATLTIANNGVVSGAVGVQGLNANVCNPNPGGGAGSGTCVFTYPVDTPLRIAANSPNPDAGFLHSGTGDAVDCEFSTCNIILTTDSSITATFDASQGPVAAIDTTLLGDGKGNVFTDNGTCQNFELGYTDCTTYYAVGSEVKFQGQSMPGNIFESFSGGVGDTAVCGANGTCLFTATGNSSVNATFSKLTSVAIEPSAATINVGNNQFFSARATFTNGMTRFGFNGNTPWQNHTPMDVERFSLAAAVVGDRLYAIGGVDGSCPSGSPCSFGPLDTVEVFNPLVTVIAEFEQAWMSRASMTTPRESLASAVVNGKIYALGGHTSGGGAVSSMEFYDPATNAWSARASMSGPRAAMAAAVINNTIYAVGGFGDDLVPLTTVEAYDTNIDAWTPRAPMLTARSFPAAAAVDGTLYVIGGDGPGSVEAYDPATDMWSMKATMPSGGGSHRAAALNGLIYAVGGSPVAVKVYNPAFDSWATLTSSMPLPVNGQFALAAFDGRLFAAGGNLADNTAVGTLSANRPPEATWWSSNTAVGPVNSGNSGSVHGEAAGTAIVSARLVDIDSGEQSATLTVTASGGGGGGGGSQIFLGIPNEAFTQVGSPNWGCGTFSQNSTGPWTVTVNYGEAGGVGESLPFTLNPAPGSPCVSEGSNAKGVFAFNHAYASVGDFTVTVTVTNTDTLQSTTGDFPIHVGESGGGGGGGGGEDECAPVTTNFTAIGSVPFSTVHLQLFDRTTGALLGEGDAPFSATELGGLPEGSFRIELSVPAGYTVTPASFDVDPVCGEPIALNATVKPIPTVPPTIVSLTPSETSLWPPNHKYHAVSIAAVATDANGADISGQCSIVSASSNEPNTDHDFVMTGPLSIDLRAERLGGGDGRRYTVAVECTDSGGLSATATALVSVPKSQSRK